MWIPVLFAIGIGSYFALPFEPPIYFIISIICSLLLTIYFYKNNQLICFICIALLIVALGFANIEFRTKFIAHNMPFVPTQKLYLSGKIENIDINYRQKQRIILSQIKNYDGQELKGKYRLTLIMGNKNLKIGDCVELVANISQPFKASLVNGYQFDRKLFFEKINATGFVSSSALPIDCKNKHISSNNFVAKIRENITNKITKSMPAEQASIAAALIAGNKNLMSAKLTNAYRNSGLAHFLSISGLHMTMIAGLAFFLVRLFMALVPALTLNYNSKKVAAVFSIFIATVYLIISGAHIPTQRAYITTIVVLIAVLLNREAISMRTLALAALFVLIISPQALISASFQMSFAAVTALIAFYEKFAGRIYRFVNNEYASSLGRIIRVLIAYIGGIIITDFVASLATLPFAIYHFNKIALYTTATNLMAGPIIGFVVMPFILFSLILMPLGLQAIALAPVGWGIAQINKITFYISGLEDSTLEVASFPLWGFLTIIFGGVWLCLWRKKWRFWGLLVIITGIFSLVFVKTPDVIVDACAKTIVTKNINDQLIALKGGSKWNKEMWFAKYGAKQNQKINQNSKFNIKRIAKGKISINSKNFDTTNSYGASFYIDKNGNITKKTVRKYIGNRLWNK